MTTHDFPQRSRHGFFRQSPHDFFDRETVVPAHLIVLFADEAEGTYNILEPDPPFDLVIPPRPDLLANWEADLAQLFPTHPGSVSLATAPARILLFHLRVNLDDPVWVALTPTGDMGVMADYVQTVRIGRDDDAPTPEFIRRAVRSFLAQFPEAFGTPPVVARITYWIDNSGSMRVTDVEGIPGVITNVIQGEVSPHPIITGEFADTNERWLRWIRRALDAAEVP